MHTVTVLTPPHTDLALHWWRCRPSDHGEQKRAYDPVCRASSGPLSRLALLMALHPRRGVVGIVCESRKNTLPYPFGSITEFKIRWTG
jgi:hypothetical protein